MDSPKLSSVVERSVIPLAASSDTDENSSPEKLAPIRDSSPQTSGEQGLESGMPIPEDLLADVPQEHRQAITRAFSSITQVAGPVFNPIFQKVTSDHVSRIIDSMESDSVREHDAGKSKRRYQLTYSVLGLGAIVGLIVFFTLSDNPDLMIPVITAVSGFLGGLATGRYFRS